MLRWNPAWQWGTLTRKAPGSEFTWGAHKLKMHREWVIPALPGQSCVSLHLNPCLSIRSFTPQLGTASQAPGKRGKVQEWQLKNVLWHCRNADTVPVGRDFPCQPFRDHLGMSPLWSLNATLSSDYFDWKYLTWFFFFSPVLSSFSSFLTLGFEVLIIFGALWCPGARDAPGTAFSFSFKAGSF